VVQKLNDELAVLRKLVGGEAQDSENPSAASGAAASVEEIVMVRIQRTEARLLQEQTAGRDLRSQIHGLIAQLSKREVEVADLNRQISQLDEDVTLSQGIAPSPVGKGASGGESGGESTAGADSNKLEMVLKRQRDRATVKQKEAEGREVAAAAETNKVALELETMKADNLKLYEKMKYIESYGQSSPTAVVAATPESVDRKYAAMYETAINPWKAFQSKEKARARASMGKSEKVTHFLNTTLFTHRRGRVLFMLYVAMLHLLVFFSSTYLQSKCSGSYSHNKQGLGHAHHIEEAIADGIRAHHVEEAAANAATPKVAVVPSAAIAEPAQKAAAVAAKEEDAKAAGAAAEDTKQSS